MSGALTGWKKFTRGRTTEVTGRLGEFWLKKNTCFKKAIGFFKLDFNLITSNKNTCVVTLEIDKNTDTEHYTGCWQLTYVY